MNNGNIVEVTDVTKDYRQGKLDVHALRGLTLPVEKGEFTAICGPSGSGKTTLLNLIGALDSPTSGSVVLEGNDLNGLTRKELSEIRRDRIGSTGLQTPGAAVAQWRTRVCVGLRALSKRRWRRRRSARSSAGWGGRWCIAARMKMDRPFSTRSGPVLPCVV